jgi:ubiquinone/menaquinone biosynthesis C-methylase UbiE
MTQNVKLPEAQPQSLNRDNIEHWPISSHTTQRQIEEWSQDEDNSSLYKQAEDDRTKFLNYKYNHLGWNESKYYFDKLGIPIKGKIVEQGAGCFWLSSYLSTFDEVEEVIGVELSKDRILAFRDIALSLFKGSRKNKIRYVVGDMHELNIPDNSVDLVVCDAVLHHADNLVAVLRESHRVLKPGGWFVALREPSISNLRLKVPQFHSRYPEDGTAQYYYRDGWKSAFLNGWFKNIKICNFMEYGYVKGFKIPWIFRKILRIIDFRIPVKYYPKICIGAQKP